MKQTKDYLEDISEIRNIMERSSNFISLSGLSGILIGIYALIGSVFAYRIVYYEPSIPETGDSYLIWNTTIIKLSILAITVLICAVSTGIYLTMKRDKNKKVSFSEPGFKNLLLNLLIPLVAGGLFILILVCRGYYGIVAPSFLIFYGLALVNGSKYTLRDIKILGIIEILLGLICALFPGYGLIFWAIGFGIMHILYGSMMYFKYER